jgi:hypothetical protein
MYNNKVVKYAKDDNTHTVPLLAYHTAANLRQGFTQTKDPSPFPVSCKTKVDNCARREAHISSSVFTGHDMHNFRYSRTLDCEQLGLRVFYKTSKHFEGILT